MSGTSYTTREVVEMLYSDPDRIASRGRFLKQHSNRKYSVRDILRLLIDVEPRRVVLDYGCGDGSFLREILADRSINEAYAADVVRHREISDLPANVTYIDVADGLPSLPYEVDAVFCMNVLYHLEKPQIADVLRAIGQLLGVRGSIFVTTKSVENYPLFRALLDRMGWRYPAEADEATFCVENARKQIAAALDPSVFEISEYHLSTQIVTRDADAVADYMISNRRYAHLAKRRDDIVVELRRRPLYVDTYHEVIIHARKRADDK